MFVVYLVFGDFVDVYWLIGVGVDVQGQKGGLDVLGVQCFEYGFVEMQVGGGCGNGVWFVGVNGLVVGFIGVFGWVFDVGWQW